MLSDALTCKTLFKSTKTSVDKNKMKRYVRSKAQIVGKVLVCGVYPYAVFVYGTP